MLYQITNSVSIDGRGLFAKLYGLGFLFERSDTEMAQSVTNLDTIKTN